ncbi:MAG: hypothetical protein ACTS73_06245 [Arsenophonus sp. NEOnobi-MAG3]
MLILASGILLALPICSIAANACSIPCPCLCNPVLTTPLLSFIQQFVLMAFMLNPPPIASFVFRQPFCSVEGIALIGVDIAIAVGFINDPLEILIVVDALAVSVTIFLINLYVLSLFT